MSFVTVPEFLKRHQKYAETYTPAWKFSDINEKTIQTHVLISMWALVPRSSSLDLPLHFTTIRDGKANLPSVTCLDPRLEPERMFDLHKGEASVIRNVAGRAKSALTEVMAITELAPIKDIMLVHHSDCGATHFTEESMKKLVAARVSGHDEELQSMYFGEIVGGDIERSVKEDVEFLRASPFVKKELTIHGYVIDVITGELKTVVE
ncbi:hypothetical protein MMC18_004611 [Xylographa bjoerkii]|nr:hypothetical protein [Xylographa bjoerkii]